jgi:phage/plasmid-associated DNA primase
MTGLIYFKTVADSYADYKIYCQAAGHNHPLGRNNFVSRMELLGFEKSHKEAGRMLEKRYSEKRF